ncbi:hypothetical protein LUI11_13365 [Bradyrhizobium diazoefficiens]|uniref:Uncharacterized protein n=3 Tax=Bradyrhizobium diazoefficiens TaxID=1355477 RepID=A0A810D317_9BRAD|nr:MULTISPECIES: hypothetical protein [Bradyrhizobium]KGJ66627.1 hypothetical protein BJA5080_03247 [Bradyrhizobium diazoefficiens SEMIA 5080]MCD9293112.1 hypothetical protein [Bradyrhizobium diazoefficiens]MCD9812426.1 hypothetical protein [Bradyrhizobium diazoefficiens]MCD9829615.1 hypothetical protein [Bradyrhizobium diazoefficiens]MCD9848827.1 hypothetical protein [Bradyrhizobium diazoefficiens]
MSPENQFAPFNRIAGGKSIGPNRAIAEYLAGTKKFARSIVKAAPLISEGAHRYVSRDDENMSHSRSVVAGETTMQKTFAILSATLIAAATIQTAAASDRHHGRKAHPVPITQSVRNSNAALWPSQPTQPDWSRYANGAMSAPAGR